MKERLAEIPIGIGLALGLVGLGGAVVFHIFVFPQPQALAVYVISVLLAGLAAGPEAGIVFSLAGTMVYIFVGQGMLKVPPLSGKILWEAAIVFLGLATVSVAAGLLRRAQDSLNQHQRIDPLTGLNNLQSFWEKSQAEIKRARRSRQPFSLIYIDIDNLKETNDLLGFVYGNRLLEAFARELRDHIRSSDIAARFGGDEFVILLPETKVEQAKGAALKIQNSFRNAAEGQNPSATISLGIVTVFNPDLELEAVMQQASDMLLQAKGQGGNIICEGVMG